MTILSETFPDWPKVSSIQLNDKDDSSPNFFSGIPTGTQLPWRKKEGKGKIPPLIH
jgi:hypothetical protein|tara:strand:+ start:298 stop:465 length:168 start_codon:yes stop_codon:yes gene_type:complete